MNPGVHKFLDRDDKKYFTTDNAKDCIQRENAALDALQMSLKSYGFTSSSSNSSSSSSSSSDSYVC